MELSRLRRTASLNFGALLSKGSSMPLTRNAQSAADMGTSRIAAVGKSSERTADAQCALAQAPSPVNNHWAAGGGYPAGNGTQQDALNSLPRVGVKLDSGKAPVAQAFVAYFSKAMEAIARVSEYGAKKYKVAFSEQNWRKVENASNRYADALQRHWGAHLRGELIDAESGKPHLDMVGWNAVALIELRDAMPEKLVDGQ